MTVGELKEYLNSVDDNKLVVLFKLDAIDTYSGWQTCAEGNIETFEEAEECVILG